MARFAFLTSIRGRDYHLFVMRGIDSELKGGIVSLRDKANSYPPELEKGERQNMRTKVAILFLLFFLSWCISFAQEADIQKNNWLLGVIFKLERMRDKAIEDIRKCEGEIQNCENTISKSENIVKLAQQQGNTKAEIIAREASIKAQEARRKNFELMKSAELNKARAAKALAYVKTGGEDLESKLEQIEYENMKPDWIKNEKQLIEQRLVEPNPSIRAISKALKTNAPPALPPVKYDELQPGDVLLISPEDKPFWDRIQDDSFWINAGDRVTTDLRSPASHTVLYLKEVNGKKLFLDHTLEGGSHVISEAEFLRTYGRRDTLVASPKSVASPDILVAQPVMEAEEIWKYTKELIKNEAKIQAKKSENIILHPISQTGYGLYGDDHMVCSEADRWVLVNSGRYIPETVSSIKKLLGIHYGPANFFSDDCNFVITPLWSAEKK
jgi:hypothetical protein